MPVLAIPSKYLITCKESRVTELVDSDCEPSRMMRILRGWPVVDREDSRPCARAISTTKTVTVSVMLRAVINVVVRRTIRLRKLYLIGIAISL